MSDREHPYTRRVFLQQGLTLASLAWTTPMFIERSARAMMMPLGSAVSSQPGVPEDRVLVVVQLGGGNDGLNTVVPYGADAYYRSRPGLAVAAPGQGDGAAITLDHHAGLGLHPEFAGFKELIDDGAAAIVQGAGYPNPNRSHFTSMDIWQTGNTNATGHGWLGRYFDNQCHGSPVADAAVAIGREAPLALTGGTHRPVTFESAETFRWRGEDIHPTLRDAYERVTSQAQTENSGDHEGERPGDSPAQPGRREVPQARQRRQTNRVQPTQESNLDFLTRTAMDARASSERIRRAVSQPPLVSYPQNPLANQLRIVSAMIRAEMPTRVYYVSLGGFDTHANQLASHGRLLRHLGDSLNAFHKDMKAQGNNSRVLTMAFSEFGRRVVQNASQGTDHGTAAPMYFVGDMVRHGLLGDHPSMTDLDQGDLRFTVDFRCLYAAVLEDWMQADSAAVLGASFRKARIMQPVQQ
jgi:uncharacterized protein (DUF1501 family)